MITRLLNLRRLHTPRSTGLVDRRSGVPARNRPDPMPRIRWYS